jgi:hypothetical protein
MADTQALPESVGPVLRGVDYALSRIQTDPDVRWLCGPGSQTFALLCEAEAHLRSEPVESVRERRSELVGSHAQETPRIPAMRKRVEELESEVATLEQKLNEWETGGHTDMAPEPVGAGGLCQEDARLIEAAADMLESVMAGAIGKAREPSPSDIQQITWRLRDRLSTGQPVSVLPPNHHTLREPPHGHQTQNQDDAEIHACPGPADMARGG